VVTGQRIHDGLVETVAHVQRAGDVGRRQQDAKVVGFGGVQSGGEIAARFPDRVPAPLDVGGFEAFGEFHGECGKNVQRAGCGTPAGGHSRQAPILAEASVRLGANLRPAGVSAIIAASQSKAPKGFLPDP
jgi:hypothetical protein